MKFEPYPYQQTAVQWIIDKPACGLFLDMGLGKTVSTLTAVQRLIDYCEIERVLVVAPKKVAETTWTTEAAKWDHLKGLRVAKVMGSQKQRLLALHSGADVYVINRDNFVWLVGLYGGSLPFDMLIIDELTSFKKSKSQRFKAMRMARPGIPRVVGLTGTPAPNGYIDLWAQIYCLDMGQRLGKFVTRYKEQFFNIRRWNNIDIKSTLKDGSEEEIKNRIGDICLTMQAKDYLELPEMIVRTVPVELSPAARQAYAKFEKEKVLELKSELEAATDGPQSIPASSAAALMNKLSQYANGAIYDEAHDVHEIHTEKLDKLEEVIESAVGEHVLVFYQFKHDIDRIRRKLKGYRVAEYKGEKDLMAWNAGKIDVLLAHPASTAYGLNMQQGGHYIVWYGTGWDLELFQQANARLHRQGQRYPVTVFKLVCRGTVDEKASDALEGKSTKQQALLDSLSALMRKYSN